jgi:hypothetical protein
MQRVLVLMLAALSCVGCAQKATGPDAAASPTGVTGSPGETVHGVIWIPAPDQSGVQGSTAPYFVSDNGDQYDLQIPASLNELTDPASSGRSLSLTGDVITRNPVPVGEAALEIVVSNYQFDP